MYLAEEMSEERRMSNNSNTFLRPLIEPIKEKNGSCFAMLRLLFAVVEEIWIYC